MRTAMIKTDFWKEDRIFELLPDARLFYLCVLSNPERTSTPAFKCSDRLMSAYTGYNIDVINMCKKELIKKKFIDIIEDYYIICEQEHVKLTKGKLSYQLYEKDFNLLPLKVKEFLLSRSCATQDNINIDINKDNNIDINKNNNLILSEKKKQETIEWKKTEAYKLAELLAQCIAYNRTEKGKEPKPAPIKHILNWSYDIDKIHRIDNYEWDTIKKVLLWSQQNSFWKVNIRSGNTFRGKFKDYLYVAWDSERTKMIENISIV